MTAQLELESLALQMAGAAWVSIVIEVSSIQQREKQIAGVWGTQKNVVGLQHQC